MKLSEVSVQRPVFAAVLSLAILLFGVISMLRLPVREYPDIESPVVSVTTFYRGASPQTVETEVTDVLEEQLATVEGVKLITSSSREQGSVITVEFNLNRKVDEAANDVRDRVSRVRGELPSTVDDPIVAKQDVNAQPIIWLSLNGQRYTTLELTEAANNILTEKIQRLEDVEQALRTQNAEIPSGRVEGRGREFSVRTRGDLDTPEQFAAIVVAQQGDRPVRIGDIADVQVGAEDDRTVARYNTVPSIGLGIVKQQKSSTVDVAHKVHDALPRLRALLPPGMNLEVAYDSSTFIEDSIQEVLISLGVAFVLVVIVIFVFLGSLRATLIPVVAIPVSLIGTFTVVYFLGFTINILTLLAMVLAIGLVVDDAIIMLENVYRHMEMGKSRLRATLDGAQEIGFAILATTIALVAVFVPVAFLTGRVGRLFNEFGIAVAVSVLISGFIALSLTPMLCSLILRRAAGGGTHGDEDVEAVSDEGHVEYARGWRGTFDRAFHGLHVAYERTLRTALAHRGVVMGIAVFILVAIGGLFVVLPKELVPTEDRGMVFNVVLAPEGATLDYTDRYMRQVESIYQKVPAVEAFFSAVGLGFGGPGRVTDGFMFVRLKPYSQRTLTQQQIVGMLFPQLLGIPGVLAIPINLPSLGGGFGSPVQFVLQADTYEDLQRAMGPFMMEAQKLGYLLNMDTDLKLNKPQLEIDIDRDRASSLGVSVADVGNTLQTLLGGREVTRFKRGNKQYKVMLQVRPQDRSSPAAIDGLYMRGHEGLVQMASVVHVREQVAPKELNHFDRVRSATISANLPPGVTIGKALDDLNAIARRTLPPSMRTDLSGESREFVESSGGLYWLFIVALVFIFLVLAAQFESFVHPLSILFSVPLAVFGALFTLFVFRGSLNIYSQIGLIMLIGLVTKNAILIVEYSNQRRARGEPLIEAVVRASRIRLRPILMTTLTTILGVMPIALGLGAGADSRKPLGLAVVGGLLFSMLLTLVMVPVVYTLLARWAPARVKDASVETESLPAGAPAPARPK
ncbi:MAG: efflux RND transporter permease subunit [Candidatus Eisenbacteria bacterium]|uniref:Efflux RND transporter permease subunit n=1 Tax=Eiseniibacteriota bacterium TaxID=2212470 RepID=A0A9D6L6N2_UNCEI|nr:efflux RND transporter permease subunit [Candidatus Eisenbacteria bacterium]